MSGTLAPSAPKKGLAMSPREVAAQVLVRVETEQSFASAALAAELGRAVQLDARDRAMATELAYGSLRYRPWLTQQVVRHAPRGLDHLDARVRALMLVAAYQILLTRVPAFAAVSEAVSAVRAARGGRLAAFANAVLRKVAAQAGEGPVDRDEALYVSSPDWLRSALSRTLGADAARDFLRSGLEPPPSALRVERAPERDAWLERLRDAAPSARLERGRVSPLALLGSGLGDARRLPGYEEGSWSVQEEGSQLVALAVGAREGELVLDACAGRGNKTAILARAVGPGGAVDACDWIEAKLDRLRGELGRLALSVRRTFAVDWQVGSGDVVDLYDRVLVDAPCTGVGTLRRRPDIALRPERGELERMSTLQRAILSGAARHVRRGGVLVYAVCSVLLEECEGVIEGFLAARQEFARSSFEDPALHDVAKGGSAFRLLPHVHGTDGYFVACLVRR
jgi:16S rRNA (cytosine967-C5)-methyltransferase